MPVGRLRRPVASGIQPGLMTTTEALTGLVVVSRGPSVALRVAGLSTVLRAVLGMQRAGCHRVALLGPEAEPWANRVAADDRVTVLVEAVSEPPEGAVLAVRDDVVLDPKALAALARGAGYRRLDAAVVAVCRTDPAPAEGLFADEGLDPGPAEGVVAWVRDAQEAEEATGRLLQSLRKPQDGMVSRRLNRTLSLAVTRRLCETGLRPNQVSVAILGVGAAGAWCASRGSWPMMALGGVLFQAQSVLDGCDGELARVTFRGSKAGEWIDTVGDDLTNYGFFAGAAWGLYRRTGKTLPLWLGAVGVGLGGVCSALEYRYLLAIGSGDLLKYPLGFGVEGDGVEAPADEGLVGRVAGLARPLFKRDFFVFATMLSTLAGPRATLGMLGAFAGGAAVTLSAVLRSEWSRGFRTPR